MERSKILNHIFNLGSNIIDYDLVYLYRNALLLLFFSIFHRWSLKF